MSKDEILTVEDLIKHIEETEEGIGVRAKGEDDESDDSED